MIALSPAARRGIFHHLIARDTPENCSRQERAAELRVEEITAYRCTECLSVYDDEDEAMDCCEPKVDGLHDEETPDLCPVCGGEFSSPHEAADCCIWKDLDATTRWKMADQVEAGATWAQVLGVHA